jgi:hypothetical protein
MLLATDLPTEAERREALAAVPWHDRARWLAVGLLRSINYGSIDLIDSAVGDGHARGLLVAAYEGTDRLIQTTFDLVESAVAASIFERTEVLDPLGLGEPIDSAGLNRMRMRLVRVPLEAAIVHLAASGNDLINSHLLLAWEANCATSDELAPFGLRLDDLARWRWTTVETAKRELAKLNDRPFSVLSAMALNAEFRRYAEHPAVIETRDWRDQVAHRERLGYEESPAFGRTSLWRTPGATVRLPRPEQTDEDLPSLAARRERLVDAGEALLTYGEAIWAAARRFFASVGVAISDERAEGKVRAEVWPGGSPTAPPRAQRDPGPFLHSDDG